MEMTLGKRIAELRRKKEMTQEELGQFDSFRRRCLRRLKERPWYLRLVYRYICCAF